MEFLGNLGIDIKLLVAQIINFGLLLWILKKFLYNPIIRRIEKDESELNRAKIQEKELEKAKEELAKQEKQSLSQSRQRAREIIAEAEEIAKEIKRRARQEAEKEKQKTVEQIHSLLKEVKNEKNK